MNGICPTTGKRQYASERDAAKGLQKFKEKSPEYEGHPYLCLYCGRHHFGARKPPVKRRRKRT